jgi:hypothetical protein
MLGVLSIGLTMAATGTYLYNMNDEEMLIDEIDDIKCDIRRCYCNYSVFREEQTLITSKILSLKNKLDHTSKFYEMALVLEKEWNRLIDIADMGNK